MKKIISILLVCASLFALSVPAMAWTAASPAIEVAQGDRMTAEQLNPEYSGASYVWNNTVAGTAVNGYSTNGDSFAVAHDGDYLYIKTTMNYLKKYNSDYTNAHQHAEEFIYVDFNTADSEVDNKIVLRVHYAAYSEDDDLDGKYTNHLTYDKLTLQDRGWSGAWGPKIYASVNKASAMENGILIGRNDDIASDSTPAVAIYHIAVPLTEDVKDAIANGSCDIGIGFAYVQLKAGFNAYFTNCGEFTLDDEKDISNDFYAVSSDNLTTVTLNGKKTDTVTKIAGVQATAVENDEYTLRLVGLLNTQNLASENIGFKLSTDNKTLDPIACGTVYKSIIADDNTCHAWWLGGDYLYCMKLTGLKVNTTYTFYAVAYHMENGEQVGDTYKITVSGNTAADITVETVA
ncbi:MAG: hypothetical protein IJY08_03530 [Clostridia bacterium]|nr:hypothetical protein [Clostridia bacterium]